MQKIIIVNKLTRSKREPSTEKFMQEILGACKSYYKAQLSEAVKRGIRLKKNKCGLSTWPVKQSKV